MPGAAKRSLLTAAAVLFASCSSRPPAEPAGAGAPTDAGPVDAGTPDAAPITTTPARVPWEVESACRRRHCYDDPDVRACFGRCRRHGHPRYPDLHANCDASCRAGHDLDACDEACALSAMAFVPVSRRSRDRCRLELASCRAACASRAPGRRATCEVECLPRFERCRP